MALNYVTKRVSREIEFRDAEWFMSGSEPDVDWSLNPEIGYGVLKPGKESLPLTERFEFANSVNTKGGVQPGNEWRDLFAIYALKRSGARVATRPPKALGPDGREIEGVTNPDAVINGRLWEFESPRNSKAAVGKGWKMNFIKEQFKEAKRIFRNPYDPDAKAPYPDYRGGIRVVINLRYKDIPRYVGRDQIMSEVRRQGEMNGAREVIVVFPDGGSGT